VRARRVRAAAVIVAMLGWSSGCIYHVEYFGAGFAPETEMAPRGAPSCAARGDAG
jgi:hypothetical protein